MSLRTNGPPFGTLMLLIVLTVLFRILGPSDIYEKTQPRTMAYTADMAANRRYLLPLDATGAAATKPPLYNWLALPLVGRLGIGSETAHKAPALASSAVLLALTVWMARRMLRKEAPEQATAAALLTGCVFVASPETFKWVYIARPDGVLMALLTAGWAASTAVLEGWTKRRAVWAAVFWFSLGAGVLTKGPVGLLPLVYAAALARLRHGGFRRLGAIHCLWGAPAAVLIVAAWAVPAWISAPDHCRAIFIGRELAYHVAGDQPGGPIVGWLGSLVKSPLYFVIRFLPWSVFAVVALVKVRPRQWFLDPLGPAILWCVVVVVTFCFVAMVKHRYLAPAFPAAAVLAVHGAHVLLKSPSRTTVVLVILSLTVCIGLGVHNAFWSNAARSPFGDAAVDFTRNANRTVAGERVLFLIRGNSPVQALMGENQTGETGAGTPADTRWVVAPMVPTAEGEPGRPVIVSEPMPRVIPGEPGAAVSIALFDRSTAQSHPSTINH